MDIKHEEIYAMAQLYQFGFCKEAEFTAFIDKYFEKYPENVLLLELEWCGGEPEKVLKVIGDHRADKEFDFDIFMREIFAGIKRAYSRCEDIRLFDSLCWDLWEMIDNYDSVLGGILYKALYKESKNDGNVQKRMAENYEKAFEEAEIYFGDKRGK